MNRIIVIGLDPASNTGYCVFSIENNELSKKQSGSISFLQKKIKTLGIVDTKNSRYGRMYNWLNDIITLYQDERTQIVIACETTEGFTRGKAAVMVANRIYGAIASCAYNRGIDIIDITPADVKGFATGRRNADKQDVINAVKKKYSFETKDDNEADAYAIAMLIVENIKSYIKHEN